MGKITRYTGNLLAFGINALAGERTVFGGAGTSDTIDGNWITDLLRGWGIVTSGDLPTKQDFNAMGFSLSQVLAYLHQVGIPEWDSAQEYHLDGFTNRNGIIYKSLINTNTGNDPELDFENWVEDGLLTVIATALNNITIRNTGGSDTSGFLAYGNSLIFTNNGVSSQTSSDGGVTWVAGGATNLAAVNDAAYDGTHWVVVGTQSGTPDAANYSSNDGAGWSPNSNSTGPLYGVAYGNSIWVLVGDSGDIETATDASSTWTGRTAAGSYTGHFQDVTWSPTLSLFIAVGTAGEIQTSPDGITWTARTAAGSYAGTFNKVSEVVFSGDGFYLVAVGTSGEIQTSPDGITWTARDNGTGTTGEFESVVGCLGYALAVGASGLMQIGIGVDEWLTIDSGITGNITEVLFESKALGFIFGNAGDLRQSLPIK